MTRTIDQIATKKTNQPYKRQNSFSRQPQCWQVFALLETVGLIATYYAVVVPISLPINRNSSLILLIFTLLSAIASFIDYVYLSCKDPVDPLILRPEQADGRREHLKLCSICCKAVEMETFHCVQCNRCTFEMDHHSKILNNCISKQQIKGFFRMVAFYSLMEGFISAHSLWIFFDGYFLQDPLLIQVQIWFSLFFGITNAIIGISGIYALSSALYIYYARKMTRLAYRYRETDSNEGEENFEDQSDISESETDHTCVPQKAKVGI